MTPIAGLTGKNRLPRLGKIHLGVKDTKEVNGKTVEYPRAVDYFVCPEIVQAIFGEQPKELRILIPIEDAERWASQYYRCYTKTRGLVCKGDGINAVRMVDMETGSLAGGKSKSVVMKDIPCQGRECPDYNKQCREVMNLQFLLPEVAGLGIWQIDTGSINSIRNINSASELIKQIYGRISMIPLILTIEPYSVQDPEGRKRDVYVLNLRTNQTLLELLQTADAKQFMIDKGEETELPIGDDELPDYIMPQVQEDAVTKEALADQATTAIVATEPGEGEEGDFIMTEIPTIEAPEDTGEKLGLIDKRWFTDSLETIQKHKGEAWSSVKILRYLVVSYKAGGTTINEAVSNLGQEAADHFVKKMQEALDSINQSAGWGDPKK